MIKPKEADAALAALSYYMIDIKKIVRFKLGSENYEMPLGIVLLLSGITLLFIIGGIYLGYQFGNSQF